MNGITCIVTGGAQGLGAATVRALRDRGARVGIIDMAPSAPVHFASDPDIAYVSASVTDEPAVIAGLNSIVARLGPIRACVNCAGVFFSAPTVSQGGAHPLPDFRRVMDINVNGTFLVLSQAAALMAQNDGIGPDEERGVIVNVSSIRAFDGGAGGMAYAASKGAIHAMTLSLARDLAPHGIRACTIAPGIMNTEMFHTLSPDAIAEYSDMVEFPKRLGDPAEFAHAVCFMIENRYMNGETLRIDAALRV
ncbi:SDR family NAD(P)-dependent oxidoreductase [Mesobacterium pallidum]|uniref:SDR family NAD(P)-dependent oxidoreductase n=1 Tax=Mesobacterium pallidum TaxID=2872037 RepID=UPI001EE390F3|nr:SDR family NAD(P)-dependent oxidoreductase [Mesobacterium pallidum]